MITLRSIEAKLHQVNQNQARQDEKVTGTEPTLQIPTAEEASRTAYELLTAASANAAGVVEAPSSRGVRKYVCLHPGCGKVFHLKASAAKHQDEEHRFRRRLGERNVRRAGCGMMFLPEWRDVTDRLHHKSIYFDSWRKLPVFYCSLGLVFSRNFRCSCPNTRFDVRLESLETLNMFATTPDHGKSSQSSSVRSHGRVHVSTTFRQFLGVALYSIPGHPEGFHMWYSRTLVPIFTPDEDDDIFQLSTSATRDVILGSSLMCTTSRSRPHYLPSCACSRLFVAPATPTPLTDQFISSVWPSDGVSWVPGSSSSPSLIHPGRDGAKASPRRTQTAIKSLKKSAGSRGERGGGGGGGGVSTADSAALGQDESSLHARFACGVPGCQHRFPEARLLGLHLRMGHSDFDLDRMKAAREGTKPTTTLDGVPVTASMDVGGHVRLAWCKLWRPRGDRR